MTPIALNKEESVLVSGSFSPEDIISLKENPSILSAKVSFIKSTLVRLYTRGFNTYILVSNGLFELIVANVITELNDKGLAIASVFIKPFPGAEVSAGEEIYTEDFVHLSISFCEDNSEFDAESFKKYLYDNTSCILLPSRVKSRSLYRIPGGISQSGRPRDVNPN